MGKHRSRSRSRDRDMKRKASRNEDSRSPSKKKKDMERERSKERKRGSRDRSRERSKDHRRDKDDKRRSRSPKSHKSRSIKKRDSSSSSSSSSGSGTKLSMSKEFLEKLEAQRRKDIEEKKKYKEQLKALETPEEKRRRRLLKKQEKERKRKEQMGWDSELLHYTNTDNPFGDSNLLDKFVWKKKLEKEGKIELTPEEIEREIRMKQLANREELEKVKTRRQEREAERAAREEEMAREQRSKEAQQFQEWQKHEDQFHLEQARLRSKIRIQDGRAKPIDVLAQYIDSENNPDTVEMHEPYFYLIGLTLEDLEDLIADIKVYMELEQESSNLDYWNDLIVIVEDEVRALRKAERESKSEYEAAMGRQEGINKAVAQDVRNTLKNKSAQALAALKAKVEQKIASRQEGVDISYWETLHSHIKAEIARARLRDRHAVNLRRKLEILKTQQGLLSSRAATDDSSQVSVKSEPMEEQERAAERPVSSLESEGQPEERDDDELEEDHDEVEHDMLQPCIEAYESGRYSPVYLQQHQVEPGQFIFTEEDDWARLEFSRAKVQGKIAATPAEPSAAEMDPYSLEERAMRGVAQKDMTADEAIFSVESTIDKPVYLWSDKYRPRKPRYFNRVHTGFEWNKYNQTHYDMDNPPPKIVQGYKFNIFYPDLINKSATPQYTVTPCADNKEFAILRFSAGPPYEDIAFKIVNREWEYSYKKGFRCQFHNNIMQLWFHFKRYRYRR